MMRRFWMMPLALMVGAASMLTSSSAECWQCTATECFFHVNCGVNCICWKGQGQVRGKCVSK